MPQMYFWTYMAMGFLCVVSLIGVVVVARKRDWKLAAQLFLAALIYGALGLGSVYLMVETCKIAPEPKPQPYCATEKPVQ